MTDDIGFSETESQGTGQPAKLRGLHRAAPGQIGTGHRAVKMLRPICNICAPDTSQAAAHWWTDCPHDPYIGEKGEIITDREYATDPSGGRYVSSESSRTVLRPWPNFVPISRVTRISSGLGPEYKRAFHGFILPSELRNEAFPNGIADCCEYWECYYQDDLQEYSTGTFCQEDESVAVYQDAIGRTVEVNNREIAADQFEADRSKVRVVSQ